MPSGVRLEQIRVSNLTIVNEAQFNNEEITFNVNNTVTKGDKENACFCQSNVTLFLTKEANIQKTFFVSLTIQGNLSILQETSQEDLHSLAVAEVYPHLRAMLTAIMGSCGMQPILLPPFIQ